jgi:hypothetical protein
MSTLLLVQTCSPLRVRATAESILSGQNHPELTILCSDDPHSVKALAGIRGAELVPIYEHQKKEILRSLRARHYDEIVVFWTGERSYNRMKRIALGFQAGVIHVHSGDGSVFCLTWKAAFRHWLFRRQHPLPTDHWTYFIPDEAEPETVTHTNRENVLIIQSAEPQNVLHALERLRDQPLFKNPRYSLFCRNRPEVVRQFAGHPDIYRLRAHSEIRSTWKHLRALRRERYDVAILFLTGDPSYWKVKCFAFLVGARYLLVYNENNDCFYLTIGRWIRFIAHRLGERSHQGSSPRWVYQMRLPLSLALKFVVFPFRFAWLLLVWIKLRSAGLRHSG